MTNILPWSSPTKVRAWPRRTRSAPTAALSWSRSPPVTIPTVGPSEPSGPTGVVQNKHTNEFLIPTPIAKFPTFPPPTSLTRSRAPSRAITPAALQPRPRPRSWSITARAGAEYTGLAAGKTSNGQDYIYAANEGTNPGIQVFDSSFQQVTLGTNNNPVGNPFIDPDLPAGFVPYGVRDLSLGTHQESLSVRHVSRPQLPGWGGCRVHQQRHVSGTDRL